MANSSSLAWFYSDIPESDFDLLHESIRCRALSMGKTCSLLEKSFASNENGDFAIAVSSCTAALTLIGISLGLSFDDEIIVPNRTWIATAHAFSILGVRIKVADVNKCSVISEDSISSLITDKTKAIVCVSLNGRTAVTPTIINYCAKHGLTLIEDCAQSAGCQHLVKASVAKGITHVRAYSFSMTKLISSGQGGMILVDDSDLACRIRANRVHGITSPNKLLSWNQLGGNFRMTDLHASIAYAQLLRIDEKKKSLKELYRYYYSNLNSKHVRLIPVNLDNNEIPLYIECLVSNRNHFLAECIRYHIPVRPFYPDIASASYLFPHSIKSVSPSVFETNGIYLPSGESQPQELIERTIDFCNYYSP